MITDRNILSPVIQGDGDRNHPYMSETGGATILVPVDVSSLPHLDADLVELLSSLRIILLGYYPVPDQVAPEQLREEFEANASAQIESIAADFVDRGGEVEPILVFTRDRGASIDRIAIEYRCDAVLSLGEFAGISNILVPLRGDPNLKQIVYFIGELLPETKAAVTLYHAITPGEDGTESELILRGVADRLREDGVAAERITWLQSETDAPAKEIVRMAADHDIVVIGESEPTLRKRILGDVPTRIIDQTGRPVLVVRSTEDD